jgi:hypothetical protein
MEWENIPEKIENYFGFVYLIERINAGIGEKKYYWGCKQFFSKISKPPLKGKTRKRRVVKQSDWKSYYGSSKELLFDIEKYGKESFKRTILKCCTSKWQMKYEELNYQIQNNVLFRDDVYNGIIHVRLNRAPQNLKGFYQNNI